MAPRTVEEVEAVAHLLHRDRILLRAVLEDELLEEEERPFVWNLLSDLYQSFPGVLRGKLRAVGALAVLDEVLNLEYLFEDCRGEDFLLDGEGDAEAFRVRFCPDEVRLCQANFVQSLELLETDGEKFLGFGASDGPA